LKAVDGIKNALHGLDMQLLDNSCPGSTRVPAFADNRRRKPCHAKGAAAITLRYSNATSTYAHKIAMRYNNTN